MTGIYAGTSKVLVIMPTFRGAAFVDAQIASILWQIGVDLRLVVRDDGSDDDTRVVLEAWVRRHPDQVVVLEDGEGRIGSAPGSFFHLLRTAPLGDADFIALADQDDIWFPEKMLRAVTAMRDGNADGYSCDLIALSDGTGAWHMHKAGHDVELDYLFQGASAGCTYVLSRKATEIVREVLNRLEGPLFANVSHDWTVYAICRSRGLGWVRDRRAGMLYRQHAGNDYGARRGLAEQLQRLRGVRAAWYRQHVLWLRSVVANTPNEQQVFAAVERQDRWWLVRNASRFRRAPRDIRLLRAAFLTGLF